MLGETDIQVKINSDAYHSQFHVMQNIPYEAILGWTRFPTGEGCCDRFEKQLHFPKSSKLRKTSVRLNV